MVRRELPRSCGAACARQLLLDARLDVPEATIRLLAGFEPEFGILLDGLRDALDALHPGVRYAQGTVWPEQLDQLARLAPFIVLLRTPSRHFVIVDQVGATEVRVREPAGTPEAPSLGAVGVMDREVFLERWARAFHGAVFRHV